MPTPSSNTPPTPPELPPRTHSSSCPEDIRSPGSWRPGEDGQEVNVDNDDAMSSTETMSTPTADIIEDLAESRSTTESPRPDSPSDTDRSASETIDAHTPLSHKPTEDIRESESGENAASATQHSAGCDLQLGTAGSEKLDDDDRQAPVNHDQYEPSMGFDYSNIRIFPTSPSSFLRPGSKFYGTQQSERQQYEVQVEIKYVDLRESFLCGYLRIQGLTEDNPTLTTYFEGEIIGSRYDFLTKHEGWGATEKIDLNHWGKFSAFRQYSKQVRKGVPVAIPNLAQRENIFMRWKEHFLVPDHRVTSINGASFEGFYYICFNQKEGSVSGIYFHSKSEKFQQLELKHVEDRGCFSAMEFR
ncbi:hypothetical protein HD806DRAFT_165232 [Xylariaceae sp. AK1471]|nr:hypothetical protein HD806DRAFT_165232 [Xylariaceae sp. AK1471]